MKRLVMLVVAGMMGLLLVACGEHAQKKEVKTETTVEKTVTETPAPEATVAAPAPAATTEAAPAAATEAAPAAEKTE